MRKEIKCHVTGKVVMVMYRDFVKRKAQVLSLVGTVENKDNRSVEIIAQGDESDLRAFIEHLHKGSFLARVARVEVEWGEPTQKFQGFSIIY